MPLGTPEFLPAMNGLMLMQIRRESFYWKEMIIWKERAEKGELSFISCIWRHYEDSFLRAM